MFDPSKWPQDLIYFGWSKICIPLRHPSALQIHFLFFFLGLTMTKLHDFPNLVNHWLHKVWLTLKMTARIDLLWVFYDIIPLKQSEVVPPPPQKKTFVFFEPCKIKSSYLSYWPFKMTERPVFELVFNTINTSRTKENGL